MTMRICARVRAPSVYTRGPCASADSARTASGTKTLNRSLSRTTETLLVLLADVKGDHVLIPLHDKRLRLRQRPRRMYAVKRDVYGDFVRAR